MYHLPTPVFTVFYSSFIAFICPRILGIKPGTLVVSLAVALLTSACNDNKENISDTQKTNLPNWQIIKTHGQPVARHEAGFVAHKQKLYLIGGRRINPTSVFDTSTNTWSQAANTPIELHHFQAVSLGDAIYIVGAMTGQWPNEKPLDRVIIYYPERDEYVYGHTIPEHRRRGGAGAAVYNNKIYLLGGITNGHMDGYQSWLDEYNPQTGEWRVLADAPQARDHFHAVINDAKLYAFAGRTTSKRTNQDMALTQSHGNIYDLKQQRWLPVTESLAVPTERAGNFAFAWNNQIIIGGGESTQQVAAHNEVEAFNSKTKQWHSWPRLVQGRHGSGFAVVGDYVYTASGCGQRGGEPELTTLERLELSAALAAMPRIMPNTQARTKGQVDTSSSTAVDTTPVYGQWHTISLNFHGPETSEDAVDNPFLNYRLLVEFSHRDKQGKLHTQTIRGFYAADGDAAETSATAGNLWQVRFTPDRVGKWHYRASLRYGQNIALSDALEHGSNIKLTNTSGNFNVIATDKGGNDFRARGRLQAANGYFTFQHSDQHWLKAGTNSPENLLAYVDFDNTYRINTEAREGEAAATGDIHRYAAHLKDWRDGDPSWQQGKGKALIGALNYLASKGMNTAYFLSFNTTGDGKDVWPFIKPDDFTRFDVSKLEQWNIVFEHMQKQGIMLHMVLQETENETLFDNGDTGPQRQLYLRELIARFGHHLALVWNLGEENGPAHWSPIGQNDAQRKAMASFIKQADPYQHPVLLHTHSEDPLRADILEDMLGFEHVDGLSLQQADREASADIVALWRKKSSDAGHPWLISLDEIGKWHTGALTDAQDPEHFSLRSNVLWGTLLSGAAGIEWYFGAKQPHNDLSSEDWRQRDKLWELTAHAKFFFNEYLPYWQMQASPQLVSLASTLNTQEQDSTNSTHAKNQRAYCLSKPSEVYALYLPNSQHYQLDLAEHSNTRFEVLWYNPVTGGALQRGSIRQINGGAKQLLGTPPITDNSPATQDWVVLVRKYQD